ncbi:MAG: AAA family ATPase [Planctomycetota bacterium]
MSYTIAVAGKGGTGKTTLAALIVETLKRKLLGPILAVDADPNSTLGLHLGINCNRTVADIIEETKGLRNLPDGMDKPLYLEYQLQRVLVENKGVDLLVMGRPEGPDCYCMANNMLRGYMERIIKNYKYVVLDNEAGMEHLNRKTTQNIDTLFLVSDPTQIGLKTVKNIKELIDKLTFLVIKNKYLVLNRVKNSIQNLEPAIKNVGVPLIGTLPFEEELTNLELAERPVSDLSDDSRLLKTISEIITKIIPSDQK